MDFDKSGLGIGGIGRHDLDAEMAELIAKGEFTARERKRRGPMPHGQLWQDCPICGREPVCKTCQLCERHCTC